MPASIDRSTVDSFYSVVSAEGFRFCLEFFLAHDVGVDLAITRDLSTALFLAAANGHVCYD